MNEKFYQKSQLDIIRLSSLIKQMKSLLRMPYDYPENLDKSISKLIESFEDFSLIYRLEMRRIIKVCIEDEEYLKGLKKEYLGSIIRDIVALTESHDVEDEIKKGKEIELARREKESQENKEREEKKRKDAKLKQELDKKLMEAKLNVPIEDLGISDGVLKFLKKYEINTCRDLLDSERVLRDAKLSQEAIQHLRECISNKGLDDILLKRKLKIVSK